MNEYFSWNKKILEELSETEILNHFNNGYLFTREQKGSMYQTRSLRIALDRFAPSSENRRILAKVEGLTVSEHILPLEPYDWQIHKLGKNYYETKFGPGVFSANKIKELLTKPSESNFNRLLEYSFNGDLVGYTICYADSSIMQYAYPFYDLSKYANNFGMGMMLKAIELAKNSGKTHIYLGSATRPKDSYKLQFDGLEWFDGANWQQDLAQLKDLLLQE